MATGSSETPINAGRYPTPLRYPGGKQRLGSFFAAVLRRNDITGCHYIEPFAGGAGVALYLLQHGLVKSVHLNDFDRAIYAFWYAVTRRNAELCRMISGTPVTVAEWDRQKAVHRHKATAPLLELGFATLFLNRTNRSGILRAGMIGGRSQAGRWRLDARFDRARIAGRIRALRSVSSRIAVDCADAGEFLVATTRRRTKGLVYLDPPYFTKGPDLYLNQYTMDDHSALAKIVREKVKCPWIVTYDHVADVRRLYRGFRMQSFRLTYTADTRRQGSEVMVVSPGVSTPRTSVFCG
jgi:DNA adenine methylase